MKTLLQLLIVGFSIGASAADFGPTEKTCKYVKPVQAEAMPGSSFLDSTKKWEILGEQKAGVYDGSMFSGFKRLGTKKFYYMREVGGSSIHLVPDTALFRKNLGFCIPLSANAMSNIYLNQPRAKSGQGTNSKAAH